MSTIDTTKQQAATGGRGDRLDAGPFVAWLLERRAVHEAAYAADTEYVGPSSMPALGARDRQCQELGLPLGETGARRLLRWTKQLRSGSIDGVKQEVHTDTFPAEDVIAALDHAGVDPADLYPEHPAFAARELEPDAHCSRCHEKVTPVDGVCPWCETPVDAGAEDPRGGDHHCPRCDRMVQPAHDGSCWRCGTRPTPGIPRDPCKCGCGEPARRFDQHGRRNEGFILGHAPRTHEALVRVDGAPFADYLRGRLKNLDLIGAVAREHGMAREEVVAMLNGAPDISRKVARDALWTAARTGTTGRGAPARPGAVGYYELYPAELEARTCPSCGQGKAAKSKECKACAGKTRRRENRERGGLPPYQRTNSKLTDHIYEQALQLRAEGVPLKTIAERFFEQTTYSSADSLRVALAYRINKQAGATQPPTLPRPEGS